MGGIEVGKVGSGVPPLLSPSGPWPHPPSRPRPRRSTLPLPLPLPRMGCMHTGVDDTRGLMDDPCDVDAS